MSLVFSMIAIKVSIFGSSFSHLCDHFLFYYINIVNFFLQVAVGIRGFVQVFKQLPQLNLLTQLANTWQSNLLTLE